MDGHTADEIRAARAPLTSLLSKSEKAQRKLAPGSWQHTMLEGNIRALRIAMPLVDQAPGDSAEPAPEDLESALSALDSMIERVADTQTKFEPGTSQHSLQRNRLAALGVARRAVADTLEKVIAPSGQPSVLTIRQVPFGAPDFTALASALDAELEVRYPGLGEDGPPPVQDFLVNVVAYRGRTPVGCGALRELETGVVELKRMFVSPEARRTGAARRILEALEAEARRAGMSSIRLGTGVRQPEAVALYESAGYRRIPLFGEYEGAETCVCYEKALD